MVFAAKVSDVPEWGTHLVRVEGQAVLLVRADGDIRACEAECPHQGAPLKEAAVHDREHLRCQRHGYLFSLKSGRCDSSAKCTLRLFPVEVRGEEIFVDVTA